MGFAVDVIRPVVQCAYNADTDTWFLTFDCGHGEAYKAEYACLPTDRRCPQCTDVASAAVTSATGG